MTLIEVKNLVKKYKIMEKEDGLIGYFKSLIKPKYKEFTALLAFLLLLIFLLHFLLCNLLIHLH